MQGLMWREYGPDGYLVYAFADVVKAMHPMYLMRAFGGSLYLTGAIIMTVNVWRTILGHLRQEAPMTETPHDVARDRPVFATPQVQAQPIAAE
jgi:cytochrome c oxidase cbb3-type subunit 1